MKIMSFKKQHFVVAVLLTIVVSSCKKWEDSIVITNQDLSINLSEAIAADANLSTFSDYMKRTGVDVLLQSSKTYTVWAPGNAALTTLDPAIVNDTAKLRVFVLNHISNQAFFTRDVQTSVRVPMLNGKYNNFFGNRLEDANMVTSDRFVRNGVLHTIDKSLLVLPSLWEYITTTTSQYIQNSFIASLNFNSFNPALATIDSISFLTGLPVYHPGTGIVVRNTFNDRLFDARREEKQYTYFVIANAGFTLKADSLKTYFKASSTATTDSLDKWNVIKDLIFDTLYPTVASLPTALISKSGIVVSINKALIVDTKKVSNGIAYVFSLGGSVTAAKFQPVTIQGESPSGFQSDKTANVNYRVRRDRPDTTKSYSDIMISGHGVTDYYAFYRLTEMPTMKYNVFARAVNDFQTQAVYQSINPVYFVPPSTFTQLTAVPVFIPTAPRTPAQLWYPVPGNFGLTPLPNFYTFTAPGFAAVSTTAAGAFGELFLGSFTSNLYGTLDIRLMSGPTATFPALPVFGATGNGPMVLDYLRIVPVP